MSLATALKRRLGIDYPIVSRRRWRLPPAANWPPRYPLPAARGSMAPATAMRIGWQSSFAPPEVSASAAASSHGRCAKSPTCSIECWRTDLARYYCHSAIRSSSTP